MKKSLKFPGAFLLASTLVFPAPFAAAADYETPPTLAAKDFLPAELLKGRHYSVAPKVENDGYMNRYTIQSDFGIFGVGSTAMARIRILEVGGIAQLRELSETEAFAGALAGSAKKTAKSAAHIVTDPVGTAKGIPEGVGRMFKRVANTAGKVVDSAGEALSEEGGEGGSGTTADKAAAAGKELAGINKARRGLAKSVGVDPYSTNPVLQKELERLAPAAFGGGLTGGLATRAVPLVGQITKVSGLVWDSSPGDLEVAGRERLAKMGVTPEQADAFYKAPNLRVTSRVAIVTLLEAMGGVSGRAEVVRLASSLRNEEEADFFVTSLLLLKGCHETQGPLKRILAGPVMAWGARGDGTLVLAFAFDHLVWTKDIAAAAGRIDSEMKGDASLERVEVWSSGSFSSRARKELESLGWKVHEKAAGSLGIKS